MKRLALFLNGILAFSQTQIVTEFFYDSSSNQRYVCIAPLNLPYNSTNPPAVSIPIPPPISIASGTLVNIVVSGGVATTTVSNTSSWNAGTYAEMRILVTGSATSVLNGGYTLTSSNTTTTTFTFTTSASNGTYTDANLQISTTNPLLTQIAWNLVVFSYDGSNRTTGAATVNAGYTVPCSSRTNY